MMGLGFKLSSSKQFSLSAFLQSWHCVKVGGTDARAGPIFAPAFQSVWCLLSISTGSRGIYHVLKVIPSRIMRGFINSNRLQQGFKIIILQHPRNRGFLGTPKILGKHKFLKGDASKAFLQSQSSQFPCLFLVQKLGCWINQDKLEHAAVTKLPNLSDLKQ